MPWGGFIVMKRVDNAVGCNAVSIIFCGFYGQCRGFSVHVDNWGGIVGTWGGFIVMKRVDTHVDTLSVH